MFEVNQSYANRRGRYTVLSINPPKMTVRFEDGEVADLNIGIQHRIWENIQAEEEARNASRSRAFRHQTSQDTQHFIKAISMLAAEELTFPGWKERVAISSDAGQTVHLQTGDRLIYYAIEPQVFFAVATITGVSVAATAKDEAAEQVRYFPIDLDAHAHNLEHAIHLDSVELESHTRIKDLLSRPDTYVQITEDDFELLAELLTEVAEDEEDQDDEDEEDEEDED
jgi:hypothetical protein